MWKVFLVVLGLVGLSGCNEREDALMINPHVVHVGVFDDCEVKFVDRGYKSTSFYLARCDTTVTSTRNWTETSGKSTTHHRRTDITHGTGAPPVSPRIAEVKAALGRLTESEKAELGIK